MRHVVRTVNRVLLGLLGLALAAAGAQVLLGGLGLLDGGRDRLPAGRPWTAPGDVLLSAEARTRWAGTSWWWPVVIAALAVLVVLLLGWLLAQFRRRRLREILVDTGDGEGALLRGRALEDVVVAEAEERYGVARAHATLVGRRRSPELRLRVLLEPHADPGGVVRSLAAEELTRARTSVGLTDLPAELRLRAARHRAERVT